jgi:PKD repeat protein
VPGGSSSFFGKGARQDAKKLTTTKPTVSHKYKKPGRYTVRLTVSVAGSTSSVTHKIKVKR